MAKQKRTLTQETSALSFAFIVLISASALASGLWGKQPLWALLLEWVYIVLAAANLVMISVSIVVSIWRTGIRLLRGLDNGRKTSGDHPVREA